MIVMDCSALVEILLDTPAGRAFAQASCDPDERVISSEQLYSELANVIRTLARKGVAETRLLAMDLCDAVEAIDEFVPLSANYVEAFCEGLRLDHPVYDMFYFTLARRNGALLLTADKPLARLCEREGVAVLCPGA